jgi:hypothetical protein
MSTRRKDKPKPPKAQTKQPKRPPPRPRHFHLAKVPRRVLDWNLATYDD